MPLLALTIPQHNRIDRKLLNANGRVDANITEAARSLARHFNLGQDFFGAALQNITDTILLNRQVNPGVTQITVQYTEGRVGTGEPIRVVSHLSQHLFEDIFNEYEHMPQLPPGVQRYDRDREGYRCITFTYNIPRSYQNASFELRMAELQVQPKALPSHLPRPVFG